VTHKAWNVVVIETEPETACARCKNKKECRDVLGDGTKLCFSCATSAEKEAYGRRMFGSPSTGLRETADRLFDGLNDKEKELVKRRFAKREGK
jgi:hypothetical protein